MNKEIVGIFFIPMGIISMCMAALWQMYVMMTETIRSTVSKIKVVWRVALLFISFSLAVYLLCPNSRKKASSFFILGGGAAISAGADVAALQ